MSEPERQIRPRWLTVFVVVMTPLAFFYLFVVPMLAAASPRDMGFGGILFGGFMLIQLLMLVVLQAYDAASIVYRFPRHVWPRIIERLYGYDQNNESYAAEVPPPFVIMPMMISYCAFNYAFAVVYVFISSIDASSFSTDRQLTVVEAVYFSVMTSATVGYGDIAPNSDIARMAVVIQVGISLLYVTTLFSAFASHVRDRPIR